jgi:hypothetical protein
MPYTDDGALPPVTDEALRAALQALRPFTVVLLKPGPNFSPPGPDRDERVAALIWEHGKRNFALRTCGLMPIICPIADGGGVSGVSVFDAPPDQVERIMAGDPAVKAAIFTFEVHATRSFPGSALPA